MNNQSITINLNEGKNDVNVTTNNLTNDQSATNSIQLVSNTNQSSNGQISQVESQAIKVNKKTKKTSTKQKTNTTANNDNSIMHLSTLDLKLDESGSDEESSQGGQVVESEEDKYDENEVPINNNNNNRMESDSLPGSQPILDIIKRCAALNSSSIQKEMMSKIKQQQKKNKKKNKKNNSIAFTHDENNKLVPKTTIAANSLSIDKNIETEFESTLVVGANFTVVKDELQEMKKEKQRMHILNGDSKNYKIEVFDPEQQKRMFASDFSFDAKKELQGENRRLIDLRQEIKNAIDNMHERLTKVQSMDEAANLIFNHAQLGKSKYGPEMVKSPILFAIVDWFNEHASFMTPIINESIEKITQDSSPQPFAKIEFDTEMAEKYLMTKGIPNTQQLIDSGLRVDKDSGLIAENIPLFLKNQRMEGTAGSLDRCCYFEHLLSTSDDFNAFAQLEVPPLVYLVIGEKCPHILGVERLDIFDALSFLFSTKFADTNHAYDLNMRKKKQTLYWAADWDTAILLLSWLHAPVNFSFFDDLDDAETVSKIYDMAWNLDTSNIDVSWVAGASWSNFKCSSHFLRKEYHIDASLAMPIEMAFTITNSNRHIPLYANNLKDISPVIVRGLNNTNKSFANIRINNHGDLIKLFRIAQHNTDISKSKTYDMIINFASINPEFFGLENDSVEVDDVIQFGQLDKIALPADLTKLSEEKLRLSGEENWRHVNMKNVSDDIRAAVGTSLIGQTSGCKLNCHICLNTFFRSMLKPIIDVPLKMVELAYFFVSLVRIAEGFDVSLQEIVETCEYQLSDAAPILINGVSFHLQSILDAFKWVSAKGPYKTNEWDNKLSIFQNFKNIIHKCTDANRLNNWTTLIKELIEKKGYCSIETMTRCNTWLWTLNSMKIEDIPVLSGLIRWNLQCRGAPKTSIIVEANGMDLINPIHKVFSTIFYECSLIIKQSNNRVSHLGGRLNFRGLKWTSALPPEKDFRKLMVKEIGFESKYGNILQIINLLVSFQNISIFSTDAKKVNQLINFRAIYPYTCHTIDAPLTDIETVNVFDTNENDSYEEKRTKIYCCEEHLDSKDCATDRAYKNLFKMDRFGLRMKSFAVNNKSYRLLRTMRFSNVSNFGGLTPYVEYRDCYHGYELWYSDMKDKNKFMKLNPGFIGTHPTMWMNVTRNRMAKIAKRQSLGHYTKEEKIDKKIKEDID